MATLKAHGPLFINQINATDWRLQFCQWHFGNRGYKLCTCLFDRVPISWLQLFCVKGLHDG